MDNSSCIESILEREWSPFCDVLFYAQNLQQTSGLQRECDFDYLIEDSESSDVPVKNLSSNLKGQK